MKKRDTIAAKKYTLGPYKMLLTVNLDGDIGVWCRTPEKQASHFVRPNGVDIRLLTMKLYDKWITKQQKRLKKLAKKVDKDFDIEMAELHVVRSFNAWC